MILRKEENPPRNRGELFIGGPVAFATILRVVTRQNTFLHGKFRRAMKFHTLDCPSRCETYLPECLN
jgi:hypothetical protein